jgi:hypothetical protein
MDIVRYWFSDHDITFFNILFVSVIIFKNSNADNTHTKIYQNVLQMLLNDSKIDTTQVEKFNLDYNCLFDMGYIQDFNSLISELYKNPNSIKSCVSPTRKYKNSCFPCKSLQLSD